MQKIDNKCLKRWLYTREPSMFWNIVWPIKNKNIKLILALSLCLKVLIIWNKNESGDGTFCKRGSSSPSSLILITNPTL